MSVVSQLGQPARPLLLGGATQAQGDSHCTEAASVALQVEAFEGFGYLISRELRKGFVDCSTLASQVHWLGAGVRIPFLAESQKRYSRATAVSVDSMLPGDLVFSYESASSAPGGRHNHVAVFLGWDGNGEGWVAESRDPGGFGYRRLAETPQAGGCRRFCPNPTTTYAGGVWQHLARRVYKLGRLGARLTSGSTRGPRHMGTDIVLDNAFQVCAPAPGVVTRVVRGCRGGSTAKMVELESLSEWPSVHRLGPWDSLDVGIGEALESGDVMGMGSRAHLEGCNVTPLTRGQYLLHWETWSAESTVAEYGSSLRFKDCGAGAGGRSALRAQNPIYLAKLGVLASPILALLK